MPVDPSVILGVNPPPSPMDMYGKALNLKELQMNTQLQQQKIQENQQNIKNQQLMAKIMAVPGNFDPTKGGITDQGISQIGAVNPQMAQELATKRMAIQEQQSLLDEHKAITADKIIDRAEKIGKLIDEIKVNALTAYHDKIDKGMSPEAAFKEGQNAVTEGVDALKTSGILHPEEASRINPVFNPEKMAANSPGWRAILEKKSADKNPAMVKDVKAVIKAEQDAKKLPKGTPERAEAEEEAKLMRAQLQSSLRAQTNVYVTNREQAKQSEGLKSSIPESSQGLSGNEYLNTLPKSVQNEVKALAEGRLPISSYALRSPKMWPLIEKTMQYDPSFDASNYTIRQGVRKDFTSGKTSNNITAINTAIGHIGTMGELSEALNNGDVKRVNQLYNAISSETGHPEVNNFNIAKSAVGDELMRVFRQVGSSETEAQAWKSSWDAMNSPEQIKGGIKVAASLLHSRLDALNDTWNRGMGTNTGYPGIVSPKSNATLAKLGLSHGESGSSGAAPPIASRVAGKTTWKGHTWTCVNGKCGWAQ